MKVSARRGKLSAVDRMICHDAVSSAADDADTALLDFAAFSLSHRLDAGVWSPADAVDDDCEAVLTAATRQ